MKNGVRKLIPLGGWPAWLWRSQTCQVVYSVEQCWPSPSHCFLHLLLQVQHGWPQLSVLLGEEQWTVRWRTCSLNSVPPFINSPFISTHQRIRVASSRAWITTKKPTPTSKGDAQGVKSRVAECELSWLWETARGRGMRPDAARTCLLHQHDWTASLPVCSGEHWGFQNEEVASV